MAGVVGPAGALVCGQLSARPLPIPVLLGRNNKAQQDVRLRFPCPHERIVRHVQILRAWAQHLSNVRISSEKQKSGRAVYDDSNKRSTGIAVSHWSICDVAAAIRQAGAPFLGSHCCAAATLALLQLQMPSGACLVYSSMVQKFWLIIRVLNKSNLQN
jgi:hypothetical protein